MRALRVAGLLVLFVVVSGCGAGGAQPGGPTPSTPLNSSGLPSTTPGATGGTDELVVVARTGRGTEVTWQLTCDPPGGTHPDPATACRVLAEHGDEALPAVAKNTMCSQVYGGPERASVTGTWRGQPVSSSFARNNGCETARWASLVGLLPPPGS